MKKFKLIPFMLIPLALTSCGKNKFLGTYSFQLGRDSGTHFGVYATTTNKPYSYVDEGGETIPVTGSNVLKLRLNLGGASLGGFFDDLKINDVTLRAYYSIGKNLGNEQGNVLNFGFNINEIIDTLFPDEPENNPSGLISRDGDNPGEGEGEGDEPLPPIPDDWYDITPKQTAKFVYTTISKTTLTFNIPVSLDDLAYQLYWYGLDLAGLREVTEHPVGTHPTTKDITYINEELHYPDSHDGKLFRNYHTLSLALTKK